jgi:hypothetical protein
MLRAGQATGQGAAAAAWPEHSLRWQRSGPGGGGSGGGARGKGGAAPPPPPAQQYTCQAVFPSPQQALKLGRKNLHLFR